MTSVTEPSALPQLFQRNAWITRHQIFGIDDPIPLNNLEHARIMFAGYVGAEYRHGGVVLLAINPGGGGDSYRSVPSDEEFYSLLKAFRECKPTQAAVRFNRVNAQFASTLLSWNLWRIVEPTLDAANVSLSEIAYMNAVPYRTRNNEMPKANAREAAWQLVTGPALEALQPKMLIALGKKAGRIVEQYYRGSAETVCIPRTIGDRYISNGAKSILEHIKLFRSL